MKFIITLINLTICISITAQEKSTFSSKWRNSSSEEFKLPDSEYMVAKKGKVLYYLSNDNENIYLDLKITETPEQVRILQMGLTVWVNTDGKTHKEMGIRFPVGTMFSRGRGGNTNSVINPPTPLSQANTIELFGFKDVKVTRFPSDNPDNIRGKVRYDGDGNLLYSLIIPLLKLPFRINPSDAGQIPFTLGIEYGAAPAYGGQSGPPGGMQSRGGGGRSGRGGGGSMGGSGGMRGGARSNATVDQFSAPVLIWMKNINLTEKK